MGTPVPPDFPPLEGAKWYSVTEKGYWDGSVKKGCRGASFGSTHCCRSGLAINAYRAAGSQCTFAAFLCAPGSPAQKGIVCIKGPYDTQAACIAANP